MWILLGIAGPLAFTIAALLVIRRCERGAVELHGPRKGSSTEHAPLL